MRELKFRAWAGEEMMFPPELGDWDWEDCELFAGYNRNPTILMQYTGLHDKNGEEIYEEDVVRVLREDSFRPYVAPVYFDGGCYCTEWYHPIEKKKVVVPLNAWKIVVIGNIYENPELLKVNNP